MGIIPIIGLCVAVLLSKMWKNRLRNWFLLTNKRFAIKLFTVGVFFFAVAHCRPIPHKLISKEHYLCVKAAC